jgi:hypothetical protein
MGPLQNLRWTIEPDLLRGTRKFVMALWRDWLLGRRMSHWLLIRLWNWSWQCRFLTLHTHHSLNFF